ncbi:MAG: hypothetical protein P4L49_17775 [Desulfosporosinus sp.]|nr:hypothetical protein [Desulfosporosinus sp.]
MKNMPVIILFVIAEILGAVIYYKTKDTVDMFGTWFCCYSGTSGCINTALQCSFRQRSSLFKKIVFPEKSGLVSAGSMTHKLGNDLPDCTVYAERRRGQCMMN